MVDKIATFVLHFCVAADLFVAFVYLSQKRWYAGLYWLAAATITYCSMKGMR